MKASGNIGLMENECHFKIANERDLKARFNYKGQSKDTLLCLSHVIGSRGGLRDVDPEVLDEAIFENIIGSKHKLARIIDEFGYWF